ncbi:MAG TPA: hypothetical protein VF188_08080 [Longimicrobiales bacterium]
MRMRQLPVPRAVRHVSAAIAVLMLLLGGAGCGTRLRAQAPEGGAAGDRSAAASRVDPALFQDLEYRMIGPSRGGRVTAVAGHRAQPSTFYMGSTGGGVWKTTDYGRNWENISDGYFQTASIGAIRVAPSNPDIIYVGTGSDGIRSNIITGRGVYKSTDAGETWEFLGLRETGHIGAVEIHPTNPDIVFVAAIGHAFGPNPERGVFRTRDGGETWEKVLFLSDSTGAVDIEFAPDNPDEVYATAWRVLRRPWTIISGGGEDGIFKSSDGGDTWTRLTNGLPQGLVGKADLAVSPADPDRVYALIEAPPGTGGLYRSDDRGRSWRLVNTSDYLLDRPFYYLNVDADPTNADIVWVNSTGFFKSEDGGEHFERRSTPHSDNHDMWINPDDPDIFIQSNDGGANVTLDGGETWSTQLNQPTAEIYQVAVDNRFPYWVYGGQQDASTIGVPSLPPTSWRPEHPSAWWTQAGGCETGPAVPRPDDWAIVYSNCKGRFGRYNHRTGQEQQYYVGAQYMYGYNPKDLEYRFQRVSPIHISPHDPNIVYHASQYLHRSTDGGEHWETISPDLTTNDPRGQVISGTPITRDVTGEEFYSTIYAVRESPLVQGLIWVGSNDGLVHVTRDGGKHWIDVTPEDLRPGGRIQNIEPSPHDPAKAYIAAYRYLVDDDWEPYIYRTDDYGETWTRLTTGRNGIPADFPTRVVREDPDREGLLYAGTEFGMFISFDDGAHWQPFQLNLPVTPVTDIVLHRQDLVLSTMGRSFWILDDVTPLHELDDTVAAAPAHLFQPRAAYRMRYFGSRRGGSGAEYIPPGAIIDYYLADTPAGEVTLEILDQRGTVIRAFSSAAPDDDAADDDLARLAAGTVPAVPPSAGTPRLPKTAGMHRFIWDLAYPGAWAAQSRRSGRNGPLAVPGTYRARLTVDGTSRVRAFEVRIDPRVAADSVTQADLEAQLALNLRIRDAVSEARWAAAQVTDARERLEARAAEGGAAAARAREALRALAAIEEQLVTPEGRYMQPMLIDQLEYLYGMTTRADQPPGRDAYVRFDELRAELDRLRAELQEVLRNDIARAPDVPEGSRTSRRAVQP